MKTRSTMMKMTDKELERLTALGFFPCGLSQTNEPCPQCYSLLGRFRAGMAGQKFFSPAAQKTFMSDATRSGLYCRQCHAFFEG